jgi:hypothetical protein
VRDIFFSQGGVCRAIGSLCVVGVVAGIAASVPVVGVASAGSGGILAAPKKITVRGLRKFNGERLVAVSAGGVSAVGTIKSGRATLAPPAAKSRLYVVKGGEVRAVIGALAPVTSGSVGTLATSIATVIRAGARIVGGKESRGVILARGLKGAKYKKTVDPAVRASLARVRKAIAAKGLGTGAANSAQIVAASGNGDGDKDGLHDLVDVDNDHDGVADNYDSTSNDRLRVGTNGLGFVVFSNLKIPLEESLNLFSTGLDGVRIDSALTAYQTLAIGVAGDPDDPGRQTELDCTGLTYCSEGGSGVSLSSVTAPFPGSNDKDRDGFGTIRPGPTGDFQLKTGATFAQIAAGDVLTQIITDPVTERETRVPSMLNFIFVSTPAIKKVTTLLGINQIDYGVVPQLGSSPNCIAVPSSGPVSLTIEGFRPQRPGVKAVGEGTWVDIGGSTITVDVPNAPFSSSPGPGNCRASSYGTTDPNLVLDPLGLRDRAPDRDASVANTYAFTIDLTDCLAGNPGGPLPWSSGEPLFVDLQFRSAYGDNAAQKFCVRRQ